MAAKGPHKKGAPSVAGTQTLVRALDILDCLREEGDKPMTLLEISRAVGLSVSTAHRLLKALTLRGMVAQEGGRLYTLGPRLLQLAGSILHGSDDLVTVVMPALHRLRTVTGETTSVHAILGEARVCLAELVSLQPIRMESGVGQVYPLHAGAAGKVLLAWGAGKIDELDSPSYSKVKEALPLVRPPGSRSREKLERELAAVRRLGYATSASEIVEGAFALAVPIFRENESMAAALQIAGPDTRWNPSTIEKFIPEAIAEARSCQILTFRS
jgi:DNA-binding IclR family transcriptional regulator